MELDEKREKWRAYSKAYREKNKDKVKAYNRSYQKGYTKGERKGRAHRIYALYNGDEFLDIGNKYELSDKYGLKPTYIAFLGTPYGRNEFIRKGAQGYTALRLDDE